MTPSPVIRDIVVAVVVDTHGRSLLVRLAGTTAFIQPGTVIQPGETPETALVRSLEEDFGVIVCPSTFTHIGRFTAPAANENHSVVNATAFEVDLIEPLSPMGLLGEVRWVDPMRPGIMDLAPLSRLHILPLLATRARAAASAVAVKAGTRASAKTVAGAVAPAAGAVAPAAKL